MSVIVENGATAANHQSSLNGTETTTGNAVRKGVSKKDRVNAMGGTLVESAVPRKRQELLKWNGWGYKDSKFILNSQDIVEFTGDRYPIGQLKLPFFTEWVQNTFGINLGTHQRCTAQPLPSEDRYPKTLMTEEHLIDLKNMEIGYSTEGIDRLFRAHGHTVHDIFVLRESFFARIPDVVVWPTCHEDVVKLVEYADEKNLVIIPFGGGTSVSSAVECPEYEKRPIISLDTSQMNSILWLDTENLTACIEAGIIGQDLERELQKRGFTSGHEPDSYEFSSLGGWVATRASGMKKNTYGNIEDIVVHAKMVTPKGTLDKNANVPRLSCGPDFNHIILGSEGTLGVVTEVIIKIRPLPKCKKYGSLVFPDFESGVKAMREIAKQRCQPSSIRLMDNEQFLFGQTLRESPTHFGSMLDGFKKFYLTKIKGYDLNTLCVATLLFEGNLKDVHAHEKKLYDIAGRFGGFPAGESSGKRGYTLTFVIAYIRDLGLDFKVVAESFETSVPWDRAHSLCKNVKHRVGQECKKHNIDHYMICCRVTQTYDAGCVIYFYFGFSFADLEHPCEVYTEIEERARDEIIASGGSISHHHGVGKIRKKWYPSTVSSVGVDLYRATKENLDPKNIFANGNLTQQSKL